MARTRLLRPDFFLDETVAEASPAARLLLLGLATIADREGRLEDRPKRIAAQIYPYDRNLDVDSLLAELQSVGLVRRYLAEDGALPCVALTRFATEQTPHEREPASSLPSPANYPMKSPGQEKPGLILDEPRQAEESRAYPVPDPVPDPVALPVPDPDLTALTRVGAKGSSKPPVRSLHRELEDAFADCWRAVYAEPYRATPGDRSQLGRWLAKAHPDDVAALPAMMERYLQDEDQFLVEQRRHDLTWFITRCVNKYRVTAVVTRTAKEREAARVDARFIAGKDSEMPLLAARRRP